MMTLAARSTEEVPSARIGAPTPAAATSRLLPYLALGAVLLLWGFGPPISKLISAPPLTTAFTRLWSSAIAMVAVQLALGARPTRAALRGGLIGGLAFGLNSVCFFYALSNASIATITVIGALQPGVVMIGASRIFGERLTRWILGWTAVAFCGAALAVLGAGAKVHTNLFGVACSAGSLLCMSVYFLASKRARATLGAGEYLMGVMIWASLVATPIVVAGGGLSHFAALGRADWFWIGIMLIGPGLGGQFLMGWALRWVPVSQSALILLGSTVVSILAAWPIHGEVPTMIQLVGGAIALGSVGAIVSRNR